MPESQPVVVILCGGASPEAAVSRLSAGRVQGLLTQRYDHLHVLELTPRVASELEEIQPDVVFPLLHGPHGEDGTIQGLLDTLSLPYVGSGVLGCAVSMDKYFSKKLLADLGMVTADDVLVRNQDGLTHAVDKVMDNLAFPVVVKPRSLGSTIAIQAAESLDQLLLALETAFEHQDCALVETFVTGREVTVSVLDRPEPTAMPVLEVKVSNQNWYDYEHKYTPGLCEHIIPAPLPPEQYRYCQEWAVKAHKYLQLRDMSRTDFIVPKNGDPVFLEINAIPGMTPTSMLPDAAEHSGLTMLNVVSTMIENAIRRGAR